MLGGARVTRTALVTGGAKGIGLAVSRRLRDAGYTVHVTGRDEAALGAAADTLGVVPHVCDATDEAAVDALVGGLALDVLVPNAGIGLSAPLTRTSLDDFRRVMDVNATGVFLAMRAALDGMRERGHGRVVVVASVASVTGMRFTAAYAASKHAALGLVRAAAAEVAGTGVTVNAVCPGFVDTEMSDRSVAAIADATGRSEEQARRALESLSPLDRLLTADEVASAVAYLASDDAAGINGQALVMDGGAVRG